MESLDLENDERRQQVAPRLPFGDLSNSPRSNAQPVSDEKDGINLREDTELIGLIEEQIDKGVSSHDIREEVEQDGLFTEKEKESSSEDERVSDIQDKESDMASSCSAQGQVPRSGRAHQSIFKRQLIRNDSRNESKITVYLDHELTNIQPGEDFDCCTNESEVLLEGRNSDSLTKFQLLMSNIANQQKFVIVRCSQDELLIRKQPKKTIVEQLLFTVKEPMVIQMTLDQKAGKACLFRIAGTIADFKVWTAELQGKLWDAGELILTQEQQLSLFLGKYNGALLRLKQSIMEDPFCIKVISDRRKTGLHLHFRRVMQLRENLLSEMQKRGLGSYECILQLDSFLIKESGLLASYKQHFRLLQNSYRSKKSQIMSRITIAACLEYLQVEEAEQLLAETQGFGNGKPYQRIMHQLQRLDTLGSPSQKLNCLIETYKDIQQCCNEYHHGRVSLEKMDNMLPVLIYIVLYTQAINLLPNLAMLEHYVAYKENSSGNYELERRILTNLNVSVEYIITSWDYPNKV